MKTLRPYQDEAYKSLINLIKSGSEPILLDASVGAGKSLICAETLIWAERHRYQCLCLTMNSILIGQNAQACKDQGKDSGIYCASLNGYDTNQNIIFGSPHSVHRGIKSNMEIAKKPFNILIVDECHNINHKDKNSMYMRIIHHYGRMAQENGHKFIVIGLTGTPYRNNKEYIVGENAFFKRVAAKISAPWLINQGYLARPVFNNLDVSRETFDFSGVKPMATGKFKTESLEYVIDKKHRMTGKLMGKLRVIVEGGRKGAFIFCVSKRHCEEALAALPQDEAAIISAETPHYLRKEIMTKAKNGQVKYLINVATLLTGVDVPRFQVACFLRPTESLTLFIQAMGRVLRLHDEKENALILDFAGNLERFQDWDNPILNEAIQPNENNEKDYIIPCPKCATLNTDYARRCRNINDDGSRCDKYFEWRDCTNCGGKNDIVCRVCNNCGWELIDPNSKLNPGVLKPNDIELHVQSMKCQINGNKQRFSITILYNCHNLSGNNIVINESYYLSYPKSKNVFYGQFIKKHCEKPSQWYMKMHNLIEMNKMLKQAACPQVLVVNSEHKIKKRYF